MESSILGFLQRKIKDLLRKLQEPQEDGRDFTKSESLGQSPIHTVVEIEPTPSPIKSESLQQVTYSRSFQTRSSRNENGTEHPSVLSSLNNNGDDTDASRKPWGYTEGPEKVVLVDSCPALLLTQLLVEILNRTFVTSKRVNQAEQKYELAKSNVEDAQILLENFLALIESVDDEAERDRIQEETGKIQEDLQKLSRERDQLNNQFSIHKLNLSFLQEQASDRLENALGQAKLLVESSALEKSYTQVAGSETRRSDPSVQSEDSIISLETLHRLATMEELYEREQVLGAVQHHFHDRHEEYEAELEQYYRAVCEGTCDMTRSDFDAHDVLKGSCLTRGFIEAEAAYKSVRSRARILGLIGNDPYQESGFVSEEGDGYGSDFSNAYSGDATEGKPERNFIEIWLDAVEDAEDGEDEDEERGGDEWEAREIGLSDSISCVEEGSARLRIDRWHEKCKHLT
ncbi:hypothetical protein MMC20_000871 [Loxospora ochrophaea]|nr:hypothetical protein [Loxospora ochrophaea]